MNKAKYSVYYQEYINQNYGFPPPFALSNHVEQIFI